MDIFRKINHKFKKIPRHLWILFAIIAVGIFLRTYNFHDWLDFRLDQVRDAVLVGEVVDGGEWPDFGPTMKKSGTSKDALFHVGPIYYHFQIISAKIFGNYPDKMAYPDLIFSILSIPLFYFFLKKYFDQRISLILVAIYSVSFFSIQFSRFAWNPNIIPFFIILFLVASHEFLVKRERAHWGWIVSIGIALGIGIQLHAILLVILPVVTLFVVAFSMKKDWKIWNKWVIVLFIALVLNSTQIISEIRTGFENSRIFLNSPINNMSDGSNFLTKLENTASCHIESNVFILSSLGQESCSRWYAKIIRGEKIKKFSNGLEFWMMIVVSFLFSVFGYGLMMLNFLKEKDRERKYFLGLVGFFLLISFLVMIQVIGSGFFEFRYFIYTFFAPFILLGFLLEFIQIKNKKIYAIFSVSIFLFFLFANVMTIKSIAGDLYSGNGSDENSVFLGEVESMMAYLISSSVGQDGAYFSGEDVYLKNFYQPLEYLAYKQAFNLIQSRNIDRIAEDDRPIFYIKGNSKMSTDINGFVIEDYKKFGQVVIYKLKR